MRLTIPRETLLQPLQSIIGVVEKRQALPILANVLLRLDDDTLTLTATDLEQQLVATVGVVAGAHDTGAVTIPARKLLDLVRLLPEKGSVSIDCKGDRAAIKCGTSRYSLATLPADNYPEFDTGQITADVSLPAPMLARAIDRTSFAMAVQDVRYYLVGLFVEISDKLLRVVASDGHRLALYEEAFEEPLEGLAAPVSMILPARAVKELARHIKALDDPVALAVAWNALTVHLPTISFSTKLIEGKYPDVQRILPRDFSSTYTFDRAEMKAALARAGVLTDDTYKAVTLAFGDAGLTVRVSTAESEEAEEHVHIDPRGSGLGVGFNAAYLLDALGRIEGEKARIGFPAEAKSSLIDDPADFRSRYIVMPIRL